MIQSNFTIHIGRSTMRARLKDSKFSMPIFWSSAVASAALHSLSCKKKTVAYFLDENLPQSSSWLPKKKYHHIRGKKKPMLHKLPGSLSDIRPDRTVVTVDSLPL